MKRALFLVPALALAACAAAAPETPPPALATLAAATVQLPSASALELVESFPAETTLDHADIRDASAVWLEMIHGAKKSIALSEFYATSRPGSSLEPILAALFEARGRGVRVRFLADAKFAKMEHVTLERMESEGKLEVRRYDVGALMGGVQHAKYFLVDDRVAFIGSQNFDWRSLSHIQELGVRVEIPEVAQALFDVFENDWALAGGGTPHVQTRLHDPVVFPVALGDESVTPVFSPKGWLPDERLWELPRIVELIDGAKQSVRVQLLTYATIDRDGSHFDELDQALRRATSRGVEVFLLVSDWAKKKPAIDALKDLARTGGVKIKLVTIPPASTGFIPFARVVHAKYMVVDGNESWVGSSNWERGYFYGTRNAGVIVRGPRIGERLVRFFRDGWESAYATAIDPDAEYQAPKTN